MKEIGYRIQKCREKAGLKQEEFAERVNLSPNYLSAVERGVKTPRLETFIRIVNELGVSADEILQDVLKAGVRIKCTNLEERIEQLSQLDKEKVLRVVDLLIEEFGER